MRITLDQVEDRPAVIIPTSDGRIDGRKPRHDSVITIISGLYECARVHTDTFNPVYLIPNLIFDPNL